MRYSKPNHANGQLIDPVNYQGTTANKINNLPKLRHFSLDDLRLEVLLPALISQDLVMLIALKNASIKILEYFV
jgi:hypothetical protein